METKELLKQIHTLAEHQVKVNELWELLNEDDFFNDFSFWNITEIYPDCTIKEEEDGRLKLYSANGKLLSNDGCCMDEEVPYFCNQSIGYCDDDFLGTMFVKVDDNNTFVAISYEC